jgi:hypothetical protein
LLLAVYTGFDASRRFQSAYLAHAGETWSEDDVRRFEALAGLRWLLLARTAPVEIEEERLRHATDWIADRLGGVLPGLAHLPPAR